MRILVFFFVLGVVLEAVIAEEDAKGCITVINGVKKRLVADQSVVIRCNTIRCIKGEIVNEYTGCKGPNGECKIRGDLWTNKDGKEVICAYKDDKYVEEAAPVNTLNALKKIDRAIEEMTKEETEKEEEWEEVMETEIAEGDVGEEEDEEERLEDEVEEESESLEDEAEESLEEEAEDEVESLGDEAEEGLEDVVEEAESLFGALESRM